MIFSRLSFARRLSQSSSYKWWVFLALAIGTFTSVADFGSLNVTMPTIAEHFRTDLPTTQWVLIGYALAISALLLPMGRMSDIVGRKRVYIGGFVIFLVGGVLAATSNSIAMLIAFKILQGLGASMTQGTGMAMVLATFGNEERGKALGSFITVVGTGNVAGPALGGFIAGTMGWQWVFYYGAILGLLAIAAAVLVLDGRIYSKRGAGSMSFDWLGAALSTAALVSFLMVMTTAPRLGWTYPPVLGGCAALVALVSAFIWWELRCDTPMIDLRLFKMRLISLGVASQFISFIGNSSMRFLLPFYLQAVLGYSPQQIGLIFVPASIAMIVTGPISGRLSDRFGYRWFTVSGLFMSVFGLLLLSTLTTESSVWIVAIGMLLQTGGTGTFYPPNNSSIMQQVPERRYGVMSGFINLVRNTGNITGTAVATAIVSAVMVSMGFLPNLSAVTEAGDAGLLNAFVSGLRTAYIIVAGLVFIAVIFSFIRPATSAASEVSATNADAKSEESGAEPQEVR